MTDTMKHFEKPTSSTLCSVLYLVHPKSSSIFQSCDRFKSDTSSAQGKKKKKHVKTNKQTDLGQVFQSVKSLDIVKRFRERGQEEEQENERH